MQLRLHELFYLEFAEHKLGVCDFEIPLKPLNYQLCMILLQQFQIY